MSSECPVIGIDHLEFYVGNARQSAIFYTKCLGFSGIAERGMKTGDRETTGYVMQQGDIRFVLSSALTMNHPIARSVIKHGDSVGVIALKVSDVEAVYQRAIDVGAVGVSGPQEDGDAFGVLRSAAIRVFGDTVVKFVDRSDYRGVHAPGFVAVAAEASVGAALKRIDHVVGNVHRGAMEQWVDLFVRALGFDVRIHFDERVISTEFSALVSKVLQNGNTTINFNEPGFGRFKSQIEEFLDYHNGPGVQHIALETDDIVETVSMLKRNGVDFLPIPKSYYDLLDDWVAEIGAPVERLAELGILVDRDRDGYLLQLFTRPLGDRPTLFFEIIERHGSQGFGAGNFKSLFVALEREQALRGNLIATGDDALAAA